MHLPVHSPDCVQFTVTTCLARWLRLVCVHKSVRVCVYLALTAKTSIIIWLKLPVGVHEAYKRMGLPEIQYANPLRARMLRVLILLSVFCATSALREADKELEKNNGNFKDSKVGAVLWKKKDVPRLGRVRCWPGCNNPSGPGGLSFDPL